MSTNGILDFQNTNKIIFRGSDSNVVIDTSNVSLGIGIQGTETPGSNLHVVGDAYISSNLKLTTDTSILVNSNVVTNFSGPHARLPKEVPLKKYPEIIFADGKFDRNDTTNTYVQAVYTVTDSSHHIEYYGAWIFDDQTGFVTNKNLWISPINTYTTSGGAGTPTMTTSDAQCTTVDGVATPGEWVQLKLPNKVKLSSISIMGPTDGNQSSGDLGR